MKLTVKDMKRWIKLLRKAGCDASCQFGCGELLREFRMILTKLEAK